MKKTVCPLLIQRYCWTVLITYLSLLVTILHSNTYYIKYNTVLLPYINVFWKLISFSSISTGWASGFLPIIPLIQVDWQRSKAQNISFWVNLVSFLFQLTTYFLFFALVKLSNHLCVNIYIIKIRFFRAQERFNIEKISNDQTYLDW